MKFAFKQTSKSTGQNMKHAGLPNGVGTMLPHKKQNNTLQDFNKPLVEQM